MRRRTPVRARRTRQAWTPSKFEASPAQARRNARGRALCEAALRQAPLFDAAEAEREREDEVVLENRSA